MRVNMKTFELVVDFLLVLGLIASLCEYSEVRLLGYVISIGSVYLIYQIEKELERKRHRAKFYRRIGKIIEHRLAA